MRCPLTLTALAIASLLVGVAQAQTDIVNTLGNAQGSIYTNFNQTTLVGFRFTTDSTSYSLTSITGALTRQAGPGSIAPELLLYSNTGSNLPGTLLATLTTSPGAAPANFTFTSSGGVTLAANTTYWGAYRMTNAENGGVSLFQDNVNPPANTGPGTVYTGLGLSNNNGSSWGQISNSGGVWHRFSVSGTAIPEPGSLAFLALGGFLAIVRTRRKES